MFSRVIVTLSATAALVGALSAPAKADSFTFSTGDPDGKIAMASRPDAGGKVEIEAADDFVLTGRTLITSATFTGLLVGAAALPTVDNVIVEMYRVFPKDSDTTRTPAVPTRVNSPSDVEFEGRDASASDMTFSTDVLSASFTASNSVLNGIDPTALHSGGEGAVTGQEVKFTVNFTTPFDLPADHYFFVPQVQVTGGEFYWLSAPKPIVPPGTPFPAGFTDLQTWMRNQPLDPDWLRVGTDIVGPPPTGGAAPTFNAAFSLQGAPVPEPASLALLATGLVLAARRFRRR